MRTCTPSRSCPDAGWSSAPLAWITRHRRTVRDYERLPAHHETMIYWAMIVVMAGASLASPAEPRMMEHAAGQQDGMFPGFTTEPVQANGITNHVCSGGTGPPVLLLHGYPQTHVMWHQVAPVLAEQFTVICPDLRGYGDSGKPAEGPHHEGYSKRAMAQDQVAVMAALGFGRFAVAGHDRGARVALRMALEYQHAVSRLAPAVLPAIHVGRMVRHPGRPCPGGGRRVHPVFHPRGHPRLRGLPGRRRD